MADHLKDAMKGLLTEMAAPRLPEGMKKTRDPVWDSTHHISIGGKHVATIIGRKPDRFTRYAKGQHQGGGSEYGKHYYIHSEKPHYDPEKRVQHEGIHPDHSVEIEQHDYANGYGQPATGVKKVRVPHVHGSMDSAVEAIHRVHSLKTKFGNLTQEQRWQKAGDLHEQLKAHSAIADKYHAAHHALTSLGHTDLADKLHAHMEAHAANKPAIDKNDLDALSHDAHKYSWHSHSHGDDSEAMARHRLAVRAVGR